MKYLTMEESHTNSILKKRWVIISFKICLTFFNGKNWDFSGYSGKKRYFFYLWIETNIFLILICSSFNNLNFKSFDEYDDSLHRFLPRIKWQRRFLRCRDFSLFLICIPSKMLSYTCILSYRNAIYLCISKLTLEVIVLFPTFF